MKKGVILSLLSISLISASVILIPNTSVELPREVTGVPRSVPPESPASWSRTRVPSPQVPSPTKKPDKTRIYVVLTNVPDYWGFRVTMAKWNKELKYSQFASVAACPSFQPCTTVKLAKLHKDEAAVTSFGYRNDITIELNTAVKNLREAMSAACHELGHVLGLPHIEGTANTCMTAIGIYRTSPSELDVRLANRDRTWTVEEAYASSSKPIDARAVPR